MSRKMTCTWGMKFKNYLRYESCYIICTAHKCLPWLGTAVCNLVILKFESTENTGKSLELILKIPFKKLAKVLSFFFLMATLIELVKY